MYRVKCYQKIDICISCILCILTMANYKKGIEYEIYVNDYLNSLQSTHISYLWKKVPDKVLFDADLITDYDMHRLNRNKTENTLHDRGVDIIMLSRDGNINFVQCKNYKRNIHISDLSGFSYVMAHENHKNKLCHLYYTSGVSKNITNNKPSNLILCKKEFNCKSLSTIQTTTQTINNATPTYNTTPTYNLYEYQQRVKILFDKYYEQNVNDISINKKSILSMPCGTGKTILGCYISMSYNVVILITPLKQYAEQNIVKYKLYDPSRKSMLIDSDGTRDIDMINEFIETNDKILLSVTYKSCDIINELNVVNPFVIIDEFHNLSYNNVYDENDDINKIINSNNKILYMSATPRIYELENSSDIDVESMFGNVVYKMDYNEAITEGYICDYEVILPVISESLNDIQEISIGINNELNRTFSKNDLIFQKCCYLFECIKRYGTMKCILYFRDTNEIREFTKMFNMMNEYHRYEYEIDNITYVDCKKIRNNKLKEFNESTKMYFMCSVGILDEAIDIPTCDTIYITYECASKVKCVQRMSRCLRKDKPGKMGRIILWCDEMSNCFSIISAIKEIDIEFDKKVKLISINHGLNKNICKRDKELMSSNFKNIIGIQIYQRIQWHVMLNKLKQFMDENKRRPIQQSKDIEEKKLGIWLRAQQSKYREKSGNMKFENIYKEWTDLLCEYEQYVASKEKKWYEMLTNVTQYFDVNKKRPSKRSVNVETKQYGIWIVRQQRIYARREEIMKEKPIYDKWTEVRCSYRQYLMSKEEMWFDTFKDVKLYIDKYQKRPSQNLQVKKERSMCNWISDQLKNCEKRLHIMEQDNVYNVWCEFKNDDKYCEYFMNNEEIWYFRLNNVKKFIEEHDRKPSWSSEDKKERQLYGWIGCQQRNYKNKTMKTKDMYRNWLLFVNEYKKYFPS